MPWNTETDIGTAQESRHVGMTEEMTGRMAIGAAANRNQVLPPLHLRVGGVRRRGNNESGKQPKCNAADHYGSP